MIITIIIIIIIYLFNANSNFQQSSFHNRNFGILFEKKCVRIEKNNKTAIFCFPWFRLFMSDRSRSCCGQLNNCSLADGLSLKNKLLIYKIIFWSPSGGVARHHYTELCQGQAYKFSAKISEQRYSTTHHLLTYHLGTYEKSNVTSIIIPRIKLNTR